MATAETETDVKVNDLDWQILSVMSDGRRYTPAYLYNDVAELDGHSKEWIRKRVYHLRDHGLLEQVGSSSMYEITDWGEAALALRKEGADDMPPKEFGEAVRERAQTA